MISKYKQIKAVEAVAIVLHTFGACMNILLIIKVKILFLNDHIYTPNYDMQAYDGHFYIHFWLLLHRLVNCLILFAIVSLVKCIFRYRTHERLRVLLMVQTLRYSTHRKANWQYFVFKRAHNPINCVKLLNHH